MAHQGQPPQERNIVIDKDGKSHAGSYTVDIQIKDTGDVSYTNRATIRLANKIKYRRSEEWQEED